MNSLEERQQEAQRILEARGYTFTPGTYWDTNRRWFDYSDRDKTGMLIPGFVEIDESVMHVYRFQDTVVLPESMQREVDEVDRNREQEQHEPFDGAAGDGSIPPHRTA